MKNLMTFPITIISILGFILGCSESAKTPEWTKGKVLVENLESPSALIADEKYLYFVTGGHLASLNAGTSGLWKMPIGGGPPVQLFKGFQKDEKTVVLPNTFVLATDEKYVYFAAGYIYRILKDGGEQPEQIVAGSPTEMVVDEENIYWHNFVGDGMKPTPVYSVNKKGGEVKTLTDAATILDIAVDKDTFYWAQPDGIYKMPKKGGEKVLITAPKSGGRITGMTTDQNSIYFLNDETLFMIPKIGDAILQFASGVNYVHKFYTDEKNIYFVRNEGPFGTSLNKVSKTDGSVTQLDVGYIKSFAVGKEKIYVSDISKIFEIGK
jgi:Domain of unknown function (DUF5050)